MTVYFVRAVGTPYVKIGFVVQHFTLRSRLEELQCGCPHTLVIEATYPGLYPEEKAFHVRFQANRVRGEWFELDAATVATVAQPVPPRPPKPTPPRYAKTEEELELDWVIRYLQTILECVDKEVFLMYLGKHAEVIVRRGGRSFLSRSFRGEAEREAARFEKEREEYNRALAEYNRAL